ncbi:hypothetical protein FZ934_16125 [Rhizobium grahamii]|uniref:DUF2946 domain-containing protein n=1 Tax=Rhizobium grahamii TaxID=1120045 RepID=A0A5Q0CCG6_9HYPH|nr:MULTISPECIES: hypothetical protein [Rhizobium]QFY61790.1 hypothetical protein FZ934_16125 [Rhizobium grahamii]QRM49040.1 hypothetical protein F3Y33_06770 [Rhizobium sp. BG6]
MRRLFTKTKQWSVRILCALALVFVGFSHQLPALAASPTSGDFSAFVLPDGTLPTLCVTVSSETGKAHPDKAHVSGCEACRISAAVILPVPSELGGIRSDILVKAELPLRAAVIARKLLAPNTGPRAPPASLIHA